MDPNTDGKSLWVQNLTRKAGDGGWAIKPGFGLLARVDTSLTGNKLSEQQDIGLARILGVHSFYTAWGTKQIIALCRTQAWGTDSVYVSKAKWVVVYSLLVYDTAYDSVQEHVIHRHTSEELGKQVWQRRGHYNTDVDEDRQQWIDAGQSAALGDRNPVDREEAWFTDPAQGNIIFGTPLLGGYVYTPTVPTPAARAQANATFAREWSDPTSEDGLVVPLIQRRSNLEAEGGYTYYTSEEFGRPNAACIVGDRVAYAVDNTVLWSNPENPSAIVVENIDVFEEPIVALGSVIGILYVFTANRTYLLSPASGFVVSGGEKRLVAGEIGAFSPACVTRFGPTLAVAHSSGVYTLTGTTTLTQVAEAIMPLFDGEGLRSPWTQFAQTSLTAIGTVLPQVYYRLNNTTSIGAHLTTDDMGRMFFGLPALNLTFVNEGGNWAVWSTDTLVNNDEEIATTNHLPQARLTALGEDVFMVQGPLLQPQADEGMNSEADAPSRSVGFLKLGYGGSLDRNSGINEDRRYIAGEWKLSPLASQAAPEREHGYFFLGPPEVIPPGTVLDWAGEAIAATELAFYVPITMVPVQALITVGGTNLSELHLEFDFDNTNFEPIINQNAVNPYEQAFRLPVERLSAGPAYALGFADIATPQGVIVYNTTTGLPDPAGDRIRIYIDSAFGGAWTGWPDFGFIRRYRNPLMKLAFRSKKASGSLFSMYMQATTATATNTAAVTADMGCKVWRDVPSDVRYDWVEANDNEAQAVDWMHHGPEIASDGQIMKSQGVVLRAYSTGQSTSNVIGAADPAGLLNLALSASRDGESGQLVDITPPMSAPPGFQALTHDPLVPRLAAVPASSAFTNAVFNGAGTWGSDAVPATGNFAIADTPVDRLTISGRMSGDSMRLTMFGHVRDKAERLKLYAVQAVVRVLGGGPRRRGR